MSSSCSPYRHSSVGSTTIPARPIGGAGISSIFERLQRPRLGLLLVKDGLRRGIHLVEVVRADKLLKHGDVRVVSWRFPGKSASERTSADARSRPSRARSSSRRVRARCRSRSPGFVGRQRPERAPSPIRAQAQCRRTLPDAQARVPLLVGALTSGRRSTAPIDSVSNHEFGCRLGLPSGSVNAK